MLGKYIKGKGKGGEKYTIRFVEDENIIDLYKLKKVLGFGGEGVKVAYWFL